MRFWIIRRRKKALEVLPSGLGIFQNSLTIFNSWGYRT
jgi:hypothetical protein